MVLRAIDDIRLPGPTGGRTCLCVGKLQGLRDALVETAHLPGDVAELGVYRGGSARFIAHHAPDATLHLFDTFTGIPEDDQLPGGHVVGDFTDTSLAEVRAFIDHPKAVYHIGVFPAVLPPEPTRYRFAHLDGDTLQTMRAALDYFIPRMVPGGVLILDDWGWEKCPGIAQVIEEYNLKAERTAEYQATVRLN
jgi:hypothetical protein